jgi:sialidase-1
VVCWEQNNWLWCSHDHGDNWSEPVPTPVVGIVPDQLLELQHGEHWGRWLLTAHTRLQPGGDAIVDGTDVVE